MRERAGDSGVPESLGRVLSDVAGERAAQDERWGVQEWPDGTSDDLMPLAQEAQAVCQAAYQSGELTWRHILAEEVAEAFAEADPVRLRQELVQVAAVAVKWIQTLDRRQGFVPHSVKYGGGMATKLVRSHMPARYPGGAHRRARDEAEYAYLLRAKLYEEVGEYLASDGDLIELADILEVVHALATRHGISPAELEQLRMAKATERGDYSGRIVWQRPDEYRAELPPPPVVRRSVRALLLDDKDQLVLIRRTVPNRDVYWTTPGGRVEDSDASLEAALYRELSEELGAATGPPRQVFTATEDTPEGRRVAVFHLCRLHSMDPRARTGPEFEQPRGQYDVEHVPLTPAAIAGINLVPEALADFLHTHAETLPELLT